MKHLLHLGPLGQMPGLSTYTLITLGFAVKDREKSSDIASTLERAANKITQSFPWLAGQVVVENPPEDPPTSTGTFKIIEYPPHSGKSKFLHFKDCKNLCSSFEDLVKSRAPASMLDGSIISPAYGFPNSYPEDVVKPVVIMQANFIKGGVLLTICTHHCVMDANGNGQFIRQFASLCAGEKLSEDNIRLGNADRTTIIPPLKSEEEMHHFELYRSSSSLGSPRGEWPPPPSKGLWKTFRFTQSKISVLKNRASMLCSPESNPPYISSNDAISTFIWSRIAAVRSAWLPKDSITQIIRAVDGRRRLDPPIPEGYMGHVILCCYTALPLSEVVNGDLSSSTMKVRRSLMGVDDKQVRSFFELLKEKKDKSTINYGAKMNGSSDIMITSFVAQKLYEESFGVLGRPEFIRRPQLPDAPSLFYMMPATRDGDVDLIACLLEKEFEGLLNDKEWNESVEFLG